MAASPYLVGCGAGFSGDRTDAALPVVKTLAARGGPSCIVFETLAERTLALAQLARRANSEAGYEPLLVEMLRPVLADCLANGIRIVGNFGAANPPGAAQCIAHLAREMNLARPRIAIVCGDDVSGAAHRDIIRSLAIDPAGELLASGAFREVKLWRRPRTHEIAQWQHDSPVQTVAVSIDGKLAATGDDARCGCSGPRCATRAVVRCSTCNRCSDDWDRPGFAECIRCACFP